MIDPQFAKDQLILLLREWFMHPNGQLPAYEWAFGDVNPPVHAWAAMRVYQIERRATGIEDTAFLERVFHKLLINFTWWVNRKDAEGRERLPGWVPWPRTTSGYSIGASSCPEVPASTRATARAGWRCSASTCWRSPWSSPAMTTRTRTWPRSSSSTSSTSPTQSTTAPRQSARDDADLWDNEDEFYYDLLRLAGGSKTYVRVRSMVGLIPLLAVETIDPELLDQLPSFHERLAWFLHNRADLVGDAASVTRTGESDRRLFAIVSAPRLKAILTRMLDEREFLSPHGLRSVSRWHAEPSVPSRHQRDALR
jgi:hypothetical protein